MRLANQTLTIGGEAPEAVLRALNATAVQIRHSFVAMSEELSTRYIDNPDWWAAPAGSRDVIASPLFFYCCWIEMLRNWPSSAPAPTVEAPSRALCHILRRLPGYANKVAFAPHRIPRWRAIAGAVRGTIAPILPAWQTRSLSDPLPTNSAITLIDTFVTPAFVETDRYYPGLLDSLSAKERTTVYFVPTFIGVDRHMFYDIIRRLRQSQGRQFIIKEDYLKIRDYAYALGHLFRIRSLRIPPTNFRGIDITELIAEELNSPRNLSSAFQSLLNFRFALRLKQAGVKIRLVVDWFENQVIDKGWNGGFRRYHPDVMTIGYQGMLVSDLWLHKYPTRTESIAKVIPEAIAAVGKVPAEMLREFFPGAQIEPAPALRFTSVHDNPTQYPDPHYFTVLIGLPITLSDSIEILDTSLAAIADLSIPELRIRIKPHPTTPQHLLWDSIKTKPVESDSFVFVDGSFTEHIESANLLISSASSVCLESLAKGVPAIILASRKGLTFNPIPSVIPQMYWRLCHSQKELCAAVTFFHANPPDREILAKSVSHDYFEPSTKDKVRTLLRLGK